MIIDTTLQDRRWVVYTEKIGGLRLAMTIGWTEPGIIVAYPDGKPLRYLTEPALVLWENIISMHKTQYEAQQHLERTDDA